MKESKRAMVTRGDKSQLKFYLLDSSNFEHLNKTPEQIPDMIQERVQEKVALGLKATDKFLIKMTI